MYPKIVAESCNGSVTCTKSNLSQVQKVQHNSFVAIGTTSLCFEYIEATGKQ